MMPPPGPQIYPRPRVTLFFDILTPKVDRGTLVPTVTKIGSFVWTGNVFTISCSQVVFNIMFTS